VTRLLAITDRARMGPDPTARVAALADVLGDRLIVLVRERGLQARVLFRWVGALLRLDVALMISARADVARCFSPQVGLHLPEAGLDIADARALLGPSVAIGASRHDAAGVRAALDAGAALVTLSPVFATPSKPGSHALGLTAFAEIAGRLPVFALGGIDPTNAPDVLRAGAAGVAAIRSAWDPANLDLRGWPSVLQGRRSPT
jgi:thiamine-phosphate pyrophosphorylase